MVVHTPFSYTLFNGMFSKSFVIIAMFWILPKLTIFVGEERGREEGKERERAEGCTKNCVVNNGIITSHVSINDTKIDLQAFSFPFFIPKNDVY